MNISNKNLLRSIFFLKANFRKAVIPGTKIFNGVELLPFNNDAKAAVCISADFELNWAWREKDLDERDLRGTIERDNFKYILQLLEDYSIPITWATVGHLFLKSCSCRKDGLAHDSMPRPHYNRRWKGDWYRHDPCSDYNKDPLWYAPDLIQQIIESKVPHEIGTHSFSHIDFSTEYSSNELVRCEMEQCATVMAPFDLKPRSLVFPFNKMGYSYLGVFSELGVIAVRHRDAKVRLSYPERTDSGVYKIYESMNLRSPKYYNYLDKAKIFIEEAAKRNAVYHLWFHPSDPIQLFKREFREIIEYIYKEREKGVVWVATMGELAAYCEAREKTKLRVQNSPSQIKILFDSSLDQDKYGVPEISISIPVTRCPHKIIAEMNSNSQELKSEMYHKKEDARIIVNAPATVKSLTVIFQ